MRPTLLLLTALICFGSVPAAAEGGRLAFVVGVDRYENLPPEAQLSVAVADANRMRTTLESLDPPFTVRMVADGDARGLESAFDAFLDEAKGAECALVYFAGHGVEYHGANFLLVKDTAISDISADVERMKRRLSTEAVSLQGWVDSLDATQAQVKVVILDCCRDNPLKAEDGSGTRSVVGGSRGLGAGDPAERHADQLLRRRRTAGQRRTFHRSPREQSQDPGPEHPEGFCEDPRRGARDLHRLGRGGRLARPRPGLPAVRGTNRPNTTS
jgi:hypothetical protein